MIGSAVVVVQMSEDVDAVGTTPCLGSSYLYLMGVEVWGDGLKFVLNNERIRLVGKSETFEIYSCINISYITYYSEHN